MNIGELLSNKQLKPKEKTQALADAILDGELPIHSVMDFAMNAKPPAVAACMEAFEYATKQSSSAASLDLLHWAQHHLNAKASRLRWESAKVIGNIAHLYPEELELAVESLLVNTKDDSTVVRWSAAYALTQIFGLPPYANDSFRNQLLSIQQSEEKESIRKMYAKALK